jgi:hypothetical protein
MNEHQPNSSPERAQSAKPTLEELGLQTDDPEQRQLWEDGLDLWGSVFVAYAHLNRPELHTRDVLYELQMAHVITHPDWQTAVITHIVERQWPEKLDRYLAMYQIPGTLVSWNPDELELYLKSLPGYVEAGGKVHIFAPQIDRHGDAGQRA